MAFRSLALPDESGYIIAVKQNATLDSSFWINSHRLGLLPHFLELFNLYYTPDVAEELREEFASGREFWCLVRAGKLVERAATNDVIKDHGPGERAAINLALEDHDLVLLIDDRRPLHEAERLGITTVCTAVFIMYLVQTARIDYPKAFETLARLAAMQTVSPYLIEAALAGLAIKKSEE